MPPIVALILCAVFVLFLLRLERKQSPIVSFAFWIPTFWMLLTSSKPLGIWFGSGGVSMEEGSALDRAFLIGLLCLGLLILGKRRFNWSRAIIENKWLMLLIGYMLVSVLWSDIPFISFKRWVKELVAVVMAFLVSTEQDSRQAMQSLLRRTIYILIPFSLVLINYFPQYGREYNRWSGELMWIGVAQQKNGLGRLCAISMVILVWTLVRRWRGRDVPTAKYQSFSDVIVLIITLYLQFALPGVYSATATVVLIAGVASLFGLWWLKKHKIILGAKMVASIIAIIIAIGTIAPFTGGSTVRGFASILGRDETLTGRTETWAQLVSVVMSQPILGGGFGSFWTTETREFYEMSNAHNGYIEILLEVGFIGILFFSLFLLSSCRKACKELIHNFDWGALWISFLLMAVLYNISESSQTFMTHNLAIVLFLTVSSSLELRWTPERVI